MNSEVVWLVSCLTITWINYNIVTPLWIRTLQYEAHQKIHQKHFCKGAFMVKTTFSPFGESSDDQNQGRNSLQNASKTSTMIPPNIWLITYHTRPQWAHRLSHHDGWHSCPRQQHFMGQGRGQVVGPGVLNQTITRQKRQRVHTRSSFKNQMNFSLFTEPSKIFRAMMPSKVRAGRIG